MAAIDRGQQVALFHLGRLPGAGAAAHHVDHHQRNFAHHGQANGLLLQRITWAGSDGDGALASVGGADGESAGGDLVFRLVHHTANFLEHFRKVVRGRSGWRDRVHGANFHTGAEYAQRQRGIAIDHDLRLGGALGRNAVAKIKIRCRPFLPGLEQHDVGIDHAAVLLAKGQFDLVNRQFHFQAVDVAQHAQGKHVLAALGVGHHGAANLFHRDLVDPVAGSHQFVMCLDVRGHDLRILVRAPHALEQDDAVRFEFLGAHPPEQHLLVEGHHQVGLITAVGDVLRTDANAVAAGPGHTACRWANFCRNDLRGPDAVAHLRCDRAQ